MDEDLIILTLTLYRECRGEPREGQVAVGNVVANRVKRNGSSFYEECVKPLQFSSMTVKGDPQTVVWPDLTDTAYMQCKNIAYSIIHTMLPDTTNGATLYYNPNSITQSKPFTLPNGEKIPFPLKWDASRVQYESQIGHHVFFREV